MSLIPLPTSPQESAPILFALLAMNGPLPAELKFGQNTVYLFGVFYCRLKLWNFLQLLTYLLKYKDLASCLNPLKNSTGFHRVKFSTPPLRLPSRSRVPQSFLSFSTLIVDNCELYVQNAVFNQNFLSKPITETKFHDYVYRKIVSFLAFPK